MGSAARHTGVAGKKTASANGRGDPCTWWHGVPGAITVTQLVRFDFAELDIETFEERQVTNGTWTLEGIGDYESLTGSGDIITNFDDGHIHMVGGLIPARQGGPGAAGAPLRPAQIARIARAAAITTAAPANPDRIHTNQSMPKRHDVPGFGPSPSVLEHLMRRVCAPGTQNGCSHHQRADRPSIGFASGESFCAAAGMIASRSHRFGCLGRGRGQQFCESPFAVPSVLEGPITRVVADVWVGSCKEQRFHGIERTIAGREHQRGDAAGTGDVGLDTMIDEGADRRKVWSVARRRADTMGIGHSCGVQQAPVGAIASVEVGCGVNKRSDDCGGRSRIVSCSPARRGQRRRLVVRVAVEGNQRLNGSDITLECGNVQPRPPVLVPLVEWRSVPDQHAGGCKPHRGILERRLFIGHHDLQRIMAETRPVGRCSQGQQEVNDFQRTGGHEGVVPRASKGSSGECPAAVNSSTRWTSPTRQASRRFVVMSGIKAHGVRSKRSFAAISPSTPPKQRDRPSTSLANWIQKAPTPADPSEMEASVPIMFLVAVVGLSTGYAFYLDVRREAANHRLVEWLRTERKASWDALGRSDRFLTIRAVEILRRGPLSDDAEFQAHYRLTRHGIRFAIAMIAAGAAVAVLILGTLLLDWDW